MTNGLIAQKALNTRALELAAATAAALEAHERICLERNQNTREVLQRIEQNVREGFERQAEDLAGLTRQVNRNRNQAVELWLIAGGAFILVLLSAIGFFVTKGT